jgi:hypothetical protein
VSEPGFVVGGRYRNAAGEYEVLALEGATTRIRYANGFEMNLPAQGLWAQWEALVAQANPRPPPSRASSAPRPSAAAARTASSATPSRSSTAKVEASPRAPRPKKGATGDVGFFTAVGYLAAGCELTASVPGRDFPGFAQRYKIQTGRNLVMPHPGLDVHERPTHRMGAELTVRFPADSNIVSYFDLGSGARIEPADAGHYSVTRTDLVERLFRLGFSLGPNTDPWPIREKLEPAQQLNFDRGLTLRRSLRRS